MFFPNSPKCVKRRKKASIGAFWRHACAFFRHEVAFLRLLTPFCAFLRFWDKLRFSAVTQRKKNEKLLLIGSLKIYYTLGCKMNLFKIAP
jgi:hypothetical protein